jgi:hypothetical protein
MVIPLTGIVIYFDLLYFFLTVCVLTIFVNMFWIIISNAGYIKSRHTGDNLSSTLELENRAMSAVRQCIEWNYGAIGNQWSYLMFKRSLRLREQQVCKNSLACMLLYNAWVTMNGSITSTNFDCEPPSFELWTSQGPRPAVVNHFWDLE